MTDELEVFDCEQRSDEWFKLRAGIPTASEFHNLMVKKGKGEGGASLKRRTYLLKLAAEIITGDPMENFVGRARQRGVDQEDEAREKYELLYEVETVRVGFMRCGRKGCSPDGLVGDDGMAQFKTADPHVLIGLHVDAVVPSEHVAQLQGEIWIARRQWTDFAVYCRKLPLFRRRVYRDDAYIADLEKQVSLFHEELDEVVERIARLSRPGAVVEMFRQSLAAAAE